MTQPLVVLNVNDDAATRYLMTKILRSGGYTVLEAVNGETALAAVSTQRPDLVLLDVKLPDMSGLDVCRRLKADPSTATILVIQTSATYSSSDRRVEGLDSGADGYLAQPFDAVELLATIRAILRTRRAEEAERKAGRRLHRTFDAIQDGLLLVDARGTIEECNDAAARMSESSALALEGQSVVSALRRVVSQDKLQALLTRSRQGRHEIEVAARDHWYRLSAYPVHGDDGSSEGTVLLVADISEQKRLEEELSARVQELAESSRRKDEFLGMLAHELRNPLHAISAATNVLDRRDAPTTLDAHASSDGSHALARASSARPRDVIHRQLAILARLVDDLLEVSRMTRGSLQLRKHRIDFAQIVRQAVQGSRALIDGRTQQLHLTVPDQPLLLEGDDLRLEQVVMNLLANASKFSAPGSTLTLDVRERWDGEQRLAELVVRDQGVGIPHDMLSKIFDPFVQVDQSLARSLGGLGIGLSMAKSLVELHGGTVIAKSEGVGKGAELIVLLPALAERSTSEPALSRSAHAPSLTSESADKNAAELRVLVVEDNEDTLELVQMWLRSLGHEVQGASDGTSGLESAITMKPDVALVDIGLPGLDGYEVARSVRASEAGSGIYMVAVTGYGRPEDRARALDAGFDAYIVKPLDVAGLKRALEPRNIAQRRATRG